MCHAAGGHRAAAALWPSGGDRRRLGYRDRAANRAHLERGPIAAIATAAPNPLRDLVRDPPRIGKTLGFAVWQGSLDILTQIEAILTFTPLLAWLRALGVLAVYVLLRATLGLRRGPALLAAALTSAGALLLWVAYFNFEKQLAGMAADGAGPADGRRGGGGTGRRRQGDKETRRQGDGRQSARLLVFSSLRLPVWRIALLAAITLAALPVAYYPALTLWAPLAAGLAVAILIEQALTPAITRLLLATVALATLTAIVSAPAILDYWHGFAYRYNEQLTTLGVFFYIPATDILGLTPYLHGQAEPSPISHLGAGRHGGVRPAGAGRAVAARRQGPTSDERPADNT